MYSHILYPTDNSEPSQRAMKHVISLTHAFGSRVSIIYVYSLPTNISTFSYNLPPEIISQMSTGVAQEGSAHLHAVQRLFRDEGIEAESHLLQGNPKSMIGQFAIENHCDLIVMGTRGKDTFTTGSTLNLMGSTSVHVILHTHNIPVLVVD